MAHSPNETGWVCRSVAAPALDADPGKLLKTGTALLCSVSYHNTTGSDAFIQIFDASALSGVTVGTTVADYQVVCAANAADTVVFSIPLHFTNGICAFSTTAHGGSSDAVVDVWFGVA